MHIKHHDTDFSLTDWSVILCSKIGLMNLGSRTMFNSLKKSSVCEKQSVQTVLECSKGNDNDWLWKAGVEINRAQGLKRTVISQICLLVTESIWDGKVPLGVIDFYQLDVSSHSVLYKAEENICTSSAGSNSEEMFKFLKINSQK